MKSPTRSMIDLQLYGILFMVISAICCSHYMECLGMNGSLYWDSHQSCVRLQIRAGVCAVPMADAVVTAKSVAIIV